MNLGGQDMRFLCEQKFVQLKKELSLVFEEQLRVASSRESRAPHTGTLQIIRKPPRVDPRAAGDLAAGLPRRPRAVSPAP